MNWITTANHTNIGTIYTTLGVWSVGIGAGISLLIRNEISCNGSLLGSDQFYFSLITAHALIMVLLVIIPLLGAGFGNWLLPLISLNNDMSFPRINALSFWTILPAFFLIVSSLSTEGGSGTGWTVYPPLSSEGHSSLSVDIAIFSLHTAGASSLMGAINLMTTLHTRIEGLQSLTLSVFSWCIGIMSLLLLISLPVFAGAVTLLLLDRNASTCLYVLTGGGDPILYQHLLWLFGHPEVYILILPGLGAVTHSIVLGSGNQIAYSRASLIVAVGVIGVMGCIVWAHHIFTVGLDLDTRAYLIAATVGIALPTGINLYSWNASLMGSPSRWNISSSWVYGFICIFTLGGTTGVVLANTVIDITLHDTLLVVGHLHYVLSIGAVISAGVGLYLWGPLFSGVNPNNSWSIGSLTCLFIGVNILFLPTHLIGLSGAPRRYDHLPDVFIGWLNTSTYGAVLSFHGLCGIVFGWFLGWIQLRIITNPNSKLSPDLIIGSTSSLHSPNVTCHNIY